MLESGGQSRKQRGDYPTPAWLVDEVVRNTMPAVVPGQRVTVLDPACGDGRFLAAAADHLRSAGAEPVLHGIDIDPAAVTAASRNLASFGADLHVGDALDGHEHGPVDIVVGNPPFLSQLAASTTRGGSSRHGGGPYADAAAEFLALAVRAARPHGGRVGLVLPQSLLASRDAGPVREEVDRSAVMVWSWWSPRRVFEADVYVCALGFERRQPLNGGGAWTQVVTDALGVPPVPPLDGTGTLGDRARLTANFREHYYALVPAVDEDGAGPPLVTSGLVDPGRCCWGARPVTFARRRYVRPTVDLHRLSPRMRRWADELLVPKVIIANQTRVIEAVADPGGCWIPGVPMLTARPHDAGDVWEIAAVLTSSLASGWAWHRAAGTGLSATTLRLGPRWLADLPWPRGTLGTAVEALRAGDLAATDRAVATAAGVDAQRVPDLGGWWLGNLPG
ncbi:MAG: HsdM family class I SAM-dependent methyltransferase [Ilumatobacteraceae bacterium]